MSTPRAPAKEKEVKKPTSKPKEAAAASKDKEKSGKADASSPEKKLPDPAKKEKEKHPDKKRTSLSLTRTAAPQPKPSVLGLDDDDDDDGDEGCGSSTPKHPTRESLLSKRPPTQFWSEVRSRCGRRLADKRCGNTVDTCDTAYKVTTWQTATEHVASPRNAISWQRPLKPQQH